MKANMMTSFTLPDLPYAADALGPVMSRETLELHHGKHHQAYVTKLNELVPGSAYDGLTLDELVTQSFGKADAQAIFNNAGQHWNHNYFWTWMAPKQGGQGGGKLPGELEQALVRDFGSVDAFKEQFVNQGVAQFGSGWVWLTQEQDGKLALMKTPNGENPLAHGKHALLGADVWEHAYYVDYRNRRADYLKAFINDLVNWDAVADRMKA